MTLASGRPLIGLWPSSSFERSRFAADVSEAPAGDNPPGPLDTSGLPTNPHKAQTTVQALDSLARSTSFEVQRWRGSESLPEHRNKCAGSAVARIQSRVRDLRSFRQEAHSLHETKLQPPLPESHACFFLEKSLHRPLAGPPDLHSCASGLLLLGSAISSSATRRALGSVRCGSCNGTI